MFKTSYFQGIDCDLGYLASIFFDTWDSQYPNGMRTLSEVGYGFYFQAVSKESYSSAEKFHIMTFSFQDVSNVYCYLGELFLSAVTDLHYGAERQACGFFELR